MIFDNSLRGSKHKTQNKNYNNKKELLKQNKINKDFLNRIKLLSLEEIIYLKLDSISSSFKGKLLGIPIYNFFPEICKEAFVIYAMSRTKNKTDACAMLGIDRAQLNKILKKYNIKLDKA